MRRTIQRRITRVQFFLSRLTVECLFVSRACRPFHQRPDDGSFVFLGTAQIAYRTALLRRQGACLPFELVFQYFAGDKRLGLFCSDRGRTDTAEHNPGDLDGFFIQGQSHCDTG